MEARAAAKLHGGLTPPANATVEQRATSYLHANCGFCHRPNDDVDCTSEPCLDLRNGLPFAMRSLCNVAPGKGDFGITGATLLTPRDPEKSMIHYRMSAPPDDDAGKHGRMPLLASYVVDDQAVQHAEQGVRLSPLDARLFWHEGVLGQAHYIAGEYEQALEWSRSAFERNGSRRANLRTMIATLVALGRKEEAVEAARLLISLEPTFRLGSYAERCPYPTGLLEPWLARLRSAGLPA